MSNDWNPLGGGRDSFDFASGMSKALHGIEATKQTKLLEEQIRLQKEANELEKKKLAQEQERLELERKRQARMTHGQIAHGQTKHQENTGRKKCHVCGGTGKSRMSCSCGGKQYGPGHSPANPCKKCDGSGTMWCPSCGGSGEARF